MQGDLLRAYGLIGGFASAVHGVPRSTEDIDFVVIPTASNPKPLADTLGNLGVSASAVPGSSLANLAVSKLSDAVVTRSRSAMGTIHFHFRRSQ
jgi:hypothetical protein